MSGEGRTARELAHAIVCERQQSEWCHWTTDRTVHAHYCDTLTDALTAARNLALEEAATALATCKWNHADPGLTAALVVRALIQREPKATPK